jgi:hypothetical protein
MAATKKSSLFRRRLSLSQRDRMNAKEAKALKRQILALNWDANRKRAKAENLARLLVEEAHRHARITAADHRAFFKSRRIKP